MLTPYDINILPSPLGRELFESTLDSLELENSKKFSKFQEISLMRKCLDAIKRGAKKIHKNKRFP
jgi:hypothetical protein